MSEKAKYIESIETEEYAIEVVKCSCGYHMSFDSSYVDQVENIDLTCPSCGVITNTSEFE